LWESYSEKVLNDGGRTSKKDLNDDDKKNKIALMVWTAEKSKGISSWKQCYDDKLKTMSEDKDKNK
jgi:hypothetical protein